MTLCAPLDEGGYSIRVDVAQGPMARRIRTARRTDPLPRAIGLNRRSTVSVVDATAGLGRDAMVLAHLGCTVIAIERVPALCALLQLAVDDLGAEIEVVKAESTTWLANLSSENAPDVVYLDPMFSDPGRSQVKKEMQACRALAQETGDGAALLGAARLVAKDRVVVKRHPHNDPIAADVSHSVSSDRVRFDVYIKTPQ
jgi:16S rRNA (guanine1516-N2)-methyltransferase